jgi:predicted PurR-regulated permease PerM
MEAKLGNVFFVISFLLFLFLGYVIFSPFVGIITVSILLVVIFYPIHQKISKIVENSVLNSLISTLIILITLLLPFSLILFFLTKEIIELYPLIADYIRNPNLIVEKLKESPYLYKLYLKLQEFYLNKYLNKLDSNFHDSIINYLKQFTVIMFNFAKTFLSNVALIFIAIFIMAITIFFLFKDGYKLYNLVYSIIPLEKEEKDYLFSNSYAAVQAVILGSVFVAIAQAIASLIGFLVAGVEYSLALAFLTFFAAFIPFGGAFLVWAPAAIYLIVSKGLLVGILFAVYGTFVISTVDNIIRPIVVGTEIDIHPMIMFFAIIGGLITFGFLGIFIAPVIVALIDAFIMLYKKRYGTENE